MNKKWKEQFIAGVCSGKLPTYGELEESLLGAMTERKALRSELDTANRDMYEMAGWLKEMVSAYLNHDAIKLQKTLEAFVRERVKVIESEPASPATSAVSGAFH